MRLQASRILQPCGEIRAVATAKARISPQRPIPPLVVATGKINGLALAFALAKTDFRSRYAEMRDTASAEWLEAARKLVADPERLVAAIEGSFPHPAQLERFFEFSTQLFQIRLPEKLERQLVEAVQQQGIIRVREQLARDAGTCIHHEVEPFVSDCVASLRQQTAQLCGEMLESMQTGKTGVHQKTLNRLILLGWRVYHTQLTV